MAELLPTERRRFDPWLCIAVATYIVMWMGWATYLIWRTLHVH